MTFGKISRNRRITHKHDERVPLTCGFGSDMATMLRVLCAKALGKVIKAGTTTC